MSSTRDRPLVSCVLAGGIGTRLYPLTSEERPKPLLSLPVDGEGVQAAGVTEETESDDPTLLSRTLERLTVADDRYVLAGESLAGPIGDAVPDVELLVEPAAKDTGPALVYAAWRLRALVGECVLVSVPCDHVVGDVAAYQRAIERAASLAIDTDGLVALGVDPTRPATGYGYVVPEGGERSSFGEAWAAPVARFHEKPDRETAADLIDRGARWNAGIFAWAPDALLREARDSPLSRLVTALERGDPAGGFDDVEPISIDRAVMERTDRAYLTPLQSPWADVGTWDAVGRVGACNEAERVGMCDAAETVDACDAAETVDGCDAAESVGACDEDERVGRSDEEATVRLGAVDVASIESSGNVVAVGDTTLSNVSLVGVEDLVVAAADGHLVVASRTDAERVREVVDRLRGE